MSALPSLTYPQRLSEIWEKQREIRKQREETSKEAQGQGDDSSDGCDSWRKT
jgi:hypothetical protein